MRITVKNISHLVAVIVFCNILNGCVIENGIEGIDNANYVRYEITEDADTIIDPKDEYIVLLGDIQEYTWDDETAKPMIRSLSWVLNQQAAYKNISCILQNGDVSSTNAKYQWDIYRRAIQQIVTSYMPVFTCSGNHDYDWCDGAKIYKRESTHLTTFLGFCFPDSLIRTQYSVERFENVIVKLPLKNHSIDLIILEYAPRTEVLIWARNWVKSHPQQKFILMTHEMLTSKGAIASDRDPLGHFSETESTWSCPSDIIEILLKPNDNIIATICGHNGFAACNEDEINNAGKKIPIILFNLQYQQNGGDSQLLLLRLKNKEDKIECVVYHTDDRRVVQTNITGYTIDL